MSVATVLFISTNLEFNDFHMVGGGQFFRESNVKHLKFFFSEAAIKMKTFLVLKFWEGSGSVIAVLRIRNLCLDPDLELGKFKAGSEIKYSGSATLCYCYCQFFFDPKIR